MIIIEDIEDQRISQYRNLRYFYKNQEKEKIFIAEGRKVTLRILKSSLKIKSIFAISEFYSEFSELISLKNIPLEQQFTAEIDLLNQIVGFNMHSGIMAIAEQPEDAKLEDMDDRIIILNGIIDAENVGSIIRNCAAFGVDSIIIDNKSTTPYLRRSVRVGIGNIVNMKHLHTQDLSKTIEELKNLRYEICAAEINEKSKSLFNHKFKNKFALIFGNEGNGIEQSILEKCDKILHIPMNREVDSINVASSTAIFLNHIMQKF